MKHITKLLLGLTPLTSMATQAKPLIDQVQLIETRPSQIWLISTPDAKEAQVQATISYQLNRALGRHATQQGAGVTLVEFLLDGPYGMGRDAFKKS